LVKYIEIMKLREKEIRKLIEYFSNKSDGFGNPKLIMIGGYALRAFIPFSRYTRDCDFVLKKLNGWNLDKIKEWLPRDLTIEVFEKRDSYGFLRCIKILKVDKRSVKVSLDFMEGEVRGRREEQTFLIKKEFVEKSKKVGIPIADKEIEIYIPSYTDYMILKFASARPSDIRDIATLVWKNGIPEDLKRRARKMLAHPEILKKKLELMVKIISNKRFLDSWKGTFITTEFTEETKKEVLKELKKLLY